VLDEPQPQKIPLIFFRSGTRNEPVREWLKSLDEAERHAIGRDLLRVARSMEVAGRYAALSTAWKWNVGSPD
jgi:hypothetical protein